MLFTAVTRHRGGIDLDSIEIWTELSQLVNKFRLARRHRIDAYELTSQRYSEQLSSTIPYDVANRDHIQGYRDENVQRINLLRSMSLREFIGDKKNYSFYTYFSNQNPSTTNPSQNVKLKPSQVIERLDAVGIDLTDTDNLFFP
jgi:hypothetical protein